MPGKKKIVISFKRRIIYIWSKSLKDIFFLKICAPNYFNVAIFKKIGISHGKIAMLMLKDHAI